MSKFSQSKTNTSNIQYLFMLFGLITFTSMLTRWMQQTSHSMVNSDNGSEDGLLPTLNTVSMALDVTVCAMGLGTLGVTPLGALSCVPLLDSANASPLTLCGTRGVFELGDLDGVNGFTINGVSAGDQSGLSVSSAGDLNHDGINDVIIGTSLADSSYVVFGGTNVANSGTLELSSLNGSNGFKINGMGSSYGVTSLGRAGDFNGDGMDDLIIGTDHSYYHGKSYVVFGGTSIGTSGVLDLSSLDGSNGFVINGVEGQDRFGKSVSCAGDFNDDGIDDIIIGADGANPNGSSSGSSYIVYGGADIGRNGVFRLSDINGVNGFKLNGETSNDLSGYSVSTAGDINHDGIDDVIIGAWRAPGGSNFAGKSYVVFGGTNVGTSGVFELSSLNGNNGFVINGPGSSGASGFSVSAAGDFNNDGIDDVIIGAPNAAYNGNYAGASYLVFGGVSVGSSGVFDLNQLDGVNAFQLNGLEPGDYSGSSVSRAGDINGDGIDDVIIGARAGVNGNRANGAGYVVFGGASVSNSQVLDLSQLNGNNGFKLNGNPITDSTGRSIEKTGYSVSSAGDFNGDGIDDVIIGAPNVSPNGRNEAGVSYMVFCSSQLLMPTVQPSNYPSWQPSSRPTAPTSKPSRIPTRNPSSIPSNQPSRIPTNAPSGHPSWQPSSRPTAPTSKPSRIPSNQPSSTPTGRPSRFLAKSISNDDASMILVIGGASGGLVFLYLLYYCYKKHTSKHEQHDADCSPMDLGIQLPRTVNNPSAAYTTIDVSTNGLDAILDEFDTLSIPASDIIKGDLLGNGSYGDVFKGVWQEVQPIAIKEFSTANLNPEQLRDVLSELTVMRQISNVENLILLHGVAQINHKPAIIMQLAAHGSLFHLLRKSESFSNNFIYALAKGMAVGLVFLHSKKIIHRDLKSLNVLLDKDYVPKLADFGLSLLRDHSAQAQDIEIGKHQGALHQAVGTTRWLAPEVCEDKPVYSEASDIYALAVIYWELITCQVPYEEERHDAIIRNWIALGKKLDIPDSCPALLKPVITNCWGELNSRPKAKEVSKVLHHEKTNAINVDQDVVWRKDCVSGVVDRSASQATIYNSNLVFWCQTDERKPSDKNTSSLAVGENASWSLKTISV